MGVRARVVGYSLSDKAEIGIYLEDFWLVGWNRQTNTYLEVNEEFSI